MPNKKMSSVREIRKRATEGAGQGAVTAGYSADRAMVIRLLNEALATEIVCMLRYKNHAVAARGLESEAVAAEFRQHAREESAHADRLAKRIHELGGNANYNPEDLLARSHSEYREGDTLLELIRINLVAERVAIESYRELIRYLGTDDPTSRRLMEDILAREEEHADDMSTLLGVEEPEAESGITGEPERWAA